MLLLCFLSINILLVSAVDPLVKVKHNGHCNNKFSDCDNVHIFSFARKKLLFYDVNPPEGFNLRRDVYMRFATMLAEVQNRGEKVDWFLVLPPWYNIHHWRSQVHRDSPKPWSMFFDVDSMRLYTQVLELHQILQNSGRYGLKIDTLYVLQNFEDPFENGVFEEKWNVIGPCKYEGSFWGYHNITAAKVICVQFQGNISQLWDLIEVNPKDTKVMFAHAEIPLHDSYGKKPFWDCRKSMKFSVDLDNSAGVFLRKMLHCNKTKCDNYLAVHWRRQDFLRSNRSPSIKGTADQINDAIQKKSLDIKDVFIASDGTQNELWELEEELELLNYRTHVYKPNHKRFIPGQAAIIEQIICSRATYFIGTHESTFTYRIQEEREILGLDSDTTFNRLCPDEGECEKPSRWTIVH